jgi:hypothetical protein
MPCAAQAKEIKMAKAKTKPNDHADDLNDSAESSFVILNSKGNIAGERLAELTEDWWEWVLNTQAGPLDADGVPFTHPMFDSTGAYADTNNDGSVFFLAGSFGGDATREFSIEAGTPILIPLLNNLAVQFTGEGEKGVANKMLADWKTDVTDLFLEINGIPVENLQADLVRTDWFGGVVQEGSLAEYFGLSGDLDPSKSVGYWTVLDGLSEGTHTVSFGGSTSSGFSVNITNTIHIV